MRDHGIGMTEEQTAKVFNRFWRGDPARARTVGGTGLGLAIATEDTRLHGGRLEVWAEPDNGACFRLTLPLLRAQPLDPELANPLDMPPAESFTESTARVTDTGSLQLTAPPVQPAMEPDTGQMLIAFPSAPAGGAGSASAQPTPLGAGGEQGVDGGQDDDARRTGSTSAVRRDGTEKP